MEERQVSPALERPLAVEDQEMFARVWSRVMPQQEGCPIALGPVPAQPAAPQPAQRVRQEEEAPRQEVSEQKTTPVQTLQPMAGGERRDVPCLGEASIEYAPLLRELMELVQGGWQAYQSMARRNQGSTARQLGALAADQQRYLRQLGAVYFLLTGQRWQGASQGRIPSGALPSALREMFVREQRARQAYANAAQEVRDPCLLALFQDLNAEAEIHMDSIRHILERM